MYRHVHVDNFLHTHSTFASYGIPKTKTAIFCYKHRTPGTHMCHTCSPVPSHMCHTCSPVPSHMCHTCSPVPSHMCHTCSPVPSHMCHTCSPVPSHMWLLHAFLAQVSRCRRSSECEEQAMFGRGTQVSMHVCRYRIMRYDSLCVCAYVCVCVYVCIFMYTYIHTCTYIHSHTHTHMYMNTSKRIWGSSNVSPRCWCVHACVHMCMWT